MVDGAVGLLWFSVNGVLLAVAWTTSGILVPRDAMARRLLVTLLVWRASVVIVLTGLGVLHLLSPSGVVGSGLVLATVGVGWLWSRQRFGRESPGEAMPPAEAPTQGTLASRVWPLTCFLVIGFWLGRLLTAGIADYPSDWDSLAYHIPLVDHWLQAGSLYAPDCPLWFNPGGNELLALWLVAPFSGDFLVGLNNAPACLLMAVGAFELCEEIGVGRTLAQWSALAVTSTYIFYKQLSDNENDIAVAGLFLAALVCGTRLVRDTSRAPLLLWAISLGLLAGIKYYAVGYAAIAWTGVALALAFARGIRSALPAAGAGLLGMLFLAGYWYLRNFAVTGTPFFPLGFTDQTNALPQNYPNVWGSTLWGNGRPEVLPLFLQAVARMAGPCHLLAVVALPLLLPCLAGSCWYTAVRGGQVADAARRWLLTYTLCGAGLVLLVSPWGAETEPGTLNHLRDGYLPVRFGQCFLSLCVLALAVILSDCTSEFLPLRLWRGEAAGRSLLGVGLPALPGLFVAGLTVAQVASLLRNPFFDMRQAITALGVGSGLVLLGIGLPLLYRSGGCPRYACAFVIALLFAVGVAWVVQQRARRWHAGFAAYYDREFGTTVFDTLAHMDAQSTRLCAIDYRYYPFFGSGRQYRLCRPMRVRSFPELLAYLREQGVDILACVPEDSRTYGRYRHVGNWIGDNPALFEPLTPDMTLLLVRVNPRKLEEQLKSPRASLPPPP